MAGAVPSIGSLGRAAINPIRHARSDESFANAFSPQAPADAAPVPPAPPGLPPTVADASARVRAQQRQSADDQQRKRGQRASIFTSDVGVGATPLGRKTLVGS